MTICDISYETNCYGIEPLLKIFLSLDQWLNACVALERAMSSIQGTGFNKTRSKRMAIWMTGILLVVIAALFIPQFVHLHVYHDHIEERNWCVVKYKEWMEMYSTILIFFHYCAPLAINICSIICIIGITTYRRSRVQTDRSFCTHLLVKIRKNRPLFFSSLLITCLTLPHLIISLTLDCRKSSHLFWFYLFGYFLAFFPVALLFPIFVLPSELYNAEFHQFIAYARRRYEVFKINL